MGPQIRTAGPQTMASRREDDGCPRRPPFPGSATPDWSGPPAAGAVLNTQALNLADGQSYFLDVVAINGQGQLSQVVTSGPILYDASPPPTPSAAAGYNAGAVTLTIAGQTDPQSGFMTYQVAVGSTQGGDQKVPWQDLPGSQPGVYTTSIPVVLQAGTVVPFTYWFQVRSINGAGIPSAIFQGSFPLGGTSSTKPAPRVP